VKSKSVKQKWSRLWRFLLLRPQKVFVRRVGELPDRLKKHLLYVESEAGNSWLAAMRCPCGCGETLHMSLLEDDKPSWSLGEDKSGSATLHPSVWRHAGCKSHFFLRGGFIQWV
jgi:hypothetical protein